MGIMNLMEAAGRFAAAEAMAEAAKHVALEEACRLVETRAKGLIGHPNSHWAPLAVETLRRKDGVNTPLLETGEMRDSIEHTVVDSNHGYVGSNSDIAVYQELGTSRGLPPRSFLGLAAQIEGPDVAKVVARTVGAAIGAALSGSRVVATIEMLHFVGEALKPIKELGEDLVTTDEEQTR
jgi:phage gpG-like protein